MGAARYLAETREFEGTAVCIFQPAEEGLGGAKAMLKDGLFKRFPCDEIYALHNFPSGLPGKVGIRSGPAMAGSDFFDITISGRGGHAAMPHLAIDPVPIAFELGQVLQTIVSRNLDPQKAAVVSITEIQTGSSYNIIPQEVRMSGTIRFLDDDVQARIDQRIREIAAGMALSHGVEISVDIRNKFRVLENAQAQTDIVRSVASDMIGSENVMLVPPVMASEDFSDMLREVPGAFFMLGAAAGPGVHNPAYTFDDSILPVGAALFARLVEQGSVPGRN